MNRLIGNILKAGARIHAAVPCPLFALTVAAACLAAATSKPASAQEAAQSREVSGRVIAVDTVVRFVERPFSLLTDGTPSAQILVGDFWPDLREHAPGDEELLIVLEGDTEWVLTSVFGHGMFRRLTMPQPALADVLAGEKLVEMHRLADAADHDQVVLRTGTGKLILVRFSPSPAVAAWQRVPPSAGPLITADFDGDKRTDFAAYDTSQGLLLFPANSRGVFVGSPVRIRDPERASFTAADLDGDGASELLVSSGRSLVLFQGGAVAPLAVSRTLLDLEQPITGIRARAADERRPAEIALQLLDEERWRVYGYEPQSGTLSPLPGNEMQLLHARQVDFNGNGRRELFGWNETAKRWEALLEAAQGEELVRFGGGPTPGSDLRVLSGVFRARGRESVLLWDPAKGRWYMSFVRDPIPMDDVRVGVGLEATARTGVAGGFVLRDLPKGTYRLSAAKAGHTFVPEHYDITVPHEGKDELVFTFYQGEPPPYPQVCLSYNRDLLQWGYRTTVVTGECGYGQAVIAADDSTFSRVMNCCTMPPDVFTDEVVNVKETCPDGYVVATNLFDGINVALVCRQINSRRYQLGEAREGTYWGLAGSFRRETDVLQKSAIPLGLRYAIGRKDFTSYDVDGCVGKEAGGLLVSKRSKHCYDMQFRELQYRGMAGDPPAGTPVQFVPDCLQISNIFSPDASCEVIDGPGSDGAP